MNTDVTLPGNIFEDAATIHYRRGYRAARLVVHQNLMRQAKARHTLRMRLCAWALNWGRSVNQVKAIYAQMAADGLCHWTVDGEGGRDDFATFTWSEEFVSSEASEQPAAAQSDRYSDGYEAGKKAGYEAGRRARERATGESTPEPQPFHTAPTTEPQPNHKVPTHGTTPHAGAPPEPASRTQPEPDSVCLQTAGAGQPEPDGQAGAQGEPPLSVIEEFVALGMERVKAEERVKEFGPARCRDALETLAYRQGRKKVDEPVGFLVGFLVDKWPVPHGVLKRREQAEKARSQPRERLVVRPIPPAEVDPEKAAVWNARIEEMINGGGAVQ